MIAETFSVEVKTATVYARALKEAGLMTTGARGVNAPDMTPLDAARMTIALLACDGPSQAVDRVKRFGKLKQTPISGDGRAWREAIPASEFHALFAGAETLEDALCFIFGLYLNRSIDDASAWFGQQMLSLTIRPGDALAELVRWISNDDGKIIGERVIAFKGSRFDANYIPIPRGLLVERGAAPATLSMIAVSLWADAQKENA